ncbi:MAG TPA: ATP-binding cassette domain-containing protein, partial [Treponemataceae bacterium]|nr:ATP-binding cassette domain-containing protein [Treponemataceae bacterium]
MPLEVRNARYAYPSFHRGPAAKSALRGASFSVGRGEFVALMGKTGCGKSTLLQIAAGLASPSSGAVFLDGEELRKAGNEKIGIVFQYPETQLFALTAAADVGFALKRKRLPGAEREARIREAFDAVGLEYGEYAGVSPLVLSGGEKRRVAIAGILASRPDYLLLDEPTAGLDPAGRRDFLFLLDRLNRRGVSILMATHDADAVCEHCSRVIVLEEGAVAEDSPVRESVLMPASPVRSVAAALRDAGIDVGEGVFRYEELRTALAER